MHYTFLLKFNIHTCIVSPGDDWGLGLLDCWFLYDPNEFKLLSWEFPMFNWNYSKCM
jgi:hypothetical protein